jgi:DNA repair exonuclease SbcCD ATPase subunit
MIVFEKIRWKNFLSTGNDFTEVQLDKSPTTLIVGQNGAGKSTLLDALSFALFGKPHRNINKPQLVNTINGKNTEVDVEFRIGSHKFVVKRGIKPTKFEIWQNGNMINQSSAAKDYQKFLEQNILKLNHKSFHQIVVLGSSSFIPFMQLPAGHRRDVIEDLLDIGVFSKMNLILRDKDSKLKEEINNITYEYDLNKEKIALQKKYIRDITELNDEQIEKKTDQVDANQDEIEELNLVNEEFSKEIEELQQGLAEDLKKAHDKKQSLSQFTFQFQSKIKDVVKDAKFYEENDVCPTCSQSIGDDLRHEKLSTTKSKAQELNTAISDATAQFTIVEATIERLNGIAEQVREKTSTISTNNSAITRLQRQIHDLETEIDSLRGSTGDLAKANSELSELQESRNVLSEEKLKLIDAKSYNQAASEMLKDTGIKTKVIKQYLPVMNNLVNKYLQVLDFFVSFNLDESFNETIKSRHRDSFNYASFSEGEKQRIDLALLFTWRQIARMKNSTSTNLLILDETFDSSLDHDGIDNLMKILYTLDDQATNVFVISHKGDLLDGKFRSKIEFIKEHNFSKIKAA